MPSTTTATTYNGNQVFIVLAFPTLGLPPVRVDADFKSVTLTTTSETKDATRGSGQTHMQREPGLIDTKMDMVLGYNPSRIQSQLRYLAVGTKCTVILGPEGSESGKPRHEQTFILTEAPMTIEVSKEVVDFALKFEQDGAPASNIFAGATF